MYMNFKVIVFSGNDLILLQTFQRHRCKNIQHQHSGLADGRKYNVMVFFSQLLLYFVTLYLQREGDELLPGYLSLHQTCESLNLKWTPNQLINSEQNSTGDKLHTHTEETNHNSPSIPTATPVENGFVLTSYCLPQYFVFSLIITVGVNVLLITQISQYSTWIDIDLLFLSMSFRCQQTYYI